MEAIKCDKCEQFYQLSKSDEIHSLSEDTTTEMTELPVRLAPFDLRYENGRDGVHLCHKCAEDLGRIINEWFGYETDKRRLYGTPKSQIEVEYKSDDSDDDDDHTSEWGGAGPDCIIGRREAA